MSKTVLVADPGHGGIDPGTTAGGLIEKALNLATALAFRQRMLAQYDAEVVLTRDRDVDVPLRARPAVANAIEGDPVFLSFHHNNSGTTQTPRGFETYVYGPKSWVKSTGEFAPRSFELAKAMEPTLKSMCQSLGLPYVGVKDGNFAVLRECKRRAILFESFYASNPDDVAIAVKPGFIDTLAQGYVDAVAQALNLVPKTNDSPFVDVPADAWYVDDLRELKAIGALRGDTTGRLDMSNEAIRLLVVMNRLRKIDTTA